MKTEWLEWLVLLKNNHSLQKVSEITHVTPQNMGKMFANLENEMNMKLFEKKGTRLQLTKDGEEFSIVAKKILDSIDNFKNSHSSGANNLTGKITLVAASKQLVREVITPFMQKYPNVEFEYLELDLKKAFEYISEHQDALAFVPISKSDKSDAFIKQYEGRCNIHMLYKDELFFLVSKDSVLCDLPRLSLDRLKGHKLAVYFKGDELHDFNSLTMQEQGGMEIIGSNSVDYFMSLVEKDLAVGIALSGVIIDGDKRVVLKKCNETEWPPYIWSLIYNSKKEFATCEKLLVQEIEKFYMNMRNS